MIEFPVYDKIARRFGNLIPGVLFLPALMAIVGLRSSNGRIPTELFIVCGILSLLSISLFLLIHLNTNTWIQLDSGRGQLNRINRLFGWRVREKVYELSQFNRISLHRGYRGGYFATLVGRQHEVLIAVSSKLENIRATAERAAKASGLAINDQI